MASTQNQFESSYSLGALDNADPGLAGYQRISHKEQKGKGKQVIEYLTGLLHKLSIRGGKKDQVFSTFEQQPEVQHKTKDRPVDGRKLIKSATSFECFVDLPVELQLLIIKFAHLIPRIVVVRWPRTLRSEYRGSTRKLSRPVATPPALMQVSKMFRK